ncbi:MAG TPA: c-type cytochrome [Longimicrobiaceae bacterium]|jgi:mono/diheme cytochrome c family protein|nr:c-type cytochrome [Longimicrobiaceae bacterium]
MRDTFAARPRAAGALVLALVLAGGCRPVKEGGYEAVSHRERDFTQFQATNPDPPPFVPGMGGAAKLVAKNLPAGVTQAMVDQGQQMFGTVCAACHGQNGVGTGAAPALNDSKWLWISGQYPEIVARIKEGVPAPKEHPGPMPPRGGGNFSDEQVGQIAAYVYALSHQGGA